jgi:hypothetical protein
LLITNSSIGYLGYLDNRWAECKIRVNEMPLPEALGFVFIEPGTAPDVAYTILVLQAIQETNSPIFMYKLTATRVLNNLHGT